MQVERLGNIPRHGHFRLRGGRVAYMVIGRALIDLSDDGYSALLSDIDMQPFVCVANPAGVWMLMDRDLEVVRLPD